MCTLALFRNPGARWPLVVAANRDEFYQRPTGPPERLTRPSGAMVAGRDLEAGGTWLAWRGGDDPLVAGVLNRRSPEAPIAAAGATSGARSRGALPLKAIAEPDLEHALAACRREADGPYGPFTLLLADLERAVVLTNGARREPIDLPPGLTVLTNLELNDPRCPRAASARVDFARLEPLLDGSRPAREAVDALASVLSNHENSIDPDHPSPLARLCVHTSGYGTRSATVLIARRDGRIEAYHADGPPCSAPLAALDRV